MSTRWFSALAALVLVNCRPPAVEVLPVATSVQRPSNVAVYLAVTRGGEPVTELSVQNFKVYEDGKLLDSSQVDLVVLSRDLATEHHVVLLLDLTGVPDVSDRRELSKQAANFVKKARRTQPVSVFAYDGAVGLYPVDDFPRDPIATEPKSLDKLESLQVIDRSRNLNGAVIDGLSRLDSILAQVDKPVRVGTLVVFGSGPDLAGRVTHDQVSGELKRTRHDVIAITIGKELTIPIEPSAIYRSETLPKVGEAFDRAAAKTEALHGAHYLLSYCSPARGGVRDLRVEVSIVAERGEGVSGAAKLGFSAEGFAPGCSSRDIPRFVVTLVSGGSGTVPGIVPFRAPEPKPEATPEEKAPEVVAENEGAPEEAVEKPEPESPPKKKSKRPRGKRGKSAKPSGTAQGKPAGKPTSKPAAKPVAKPAVEPEKKPEKKPDPKPEKKPDPEQDYAP